MIRPGALSKAITLLGLLSPIETVPQAHADPAEFVGIGGDVVLRVSGKPVFYVTSGTRGIDALDALNGKQLWHSNLATVPLLTRGGHLLAIASGTQPDGGHRLVVLNAETGVLEGQLPPLPADAILDDTPTVRGSITARSIGDRDVLVWHTQFVPPGTPSRSTDQQLPSEVTDGAAVIDLRARSLTPTNERYPEPRIRHTGQNSTDFEIVPFDVDGVHAQILPQKNPSAPDSVIMRRTRDGRALPDIVIGDHWSTSAPPLPSIDFRHVAQLTRNAFEPRLYNVEIFVVATGKTLGSPFTVDDPPSGFVVLGNRLFYRAYLPRDRHAVDTDHIGVRDLENPATPIFVRAIKAPR
jgi:hypothetical protein